jgi:N-acetylmuramoyl-L-alanine amidase
MNKPEAIILHHSRTLDSVTLSWGAIRRDHVGGNGWDDIGYHFGIELVRNGYEVLVGRMVDHEGAHCSPCGYNRKSIGICLIGNFEVHAPPPEQLEKCMYLCLSLMRLYNIPVEKIFGHGEIDKRRSCPGVLFNINSFRDALKRRVK